MSITKLKIVSALATLSLLAGTAGVASLASAATTTTTDNATAITTSGATLNGTNGDTAATGSSFWVSTSTFSTASPTVPSGVYSTPDMGAVGASASFSAPMSSATGLPSVTPNTTYYYAAWTNVGGTWMPGAVKSFTTLATTSPSAPIISNVQISSSQSCNASATITWTTNEPTKGFISYGLTNAYGATTSTETTAATNHSVTINNLTCSTAYHFAITATDNDNNTSTSSDMTFTSGTTTNVNSISNVHVSNIGTSSVMISWNSSNPSTGMVSFGTTTGYGSTMQSTTTASTTQSVTLSNLNPGTLYHFAVSATGAATTTDSTFTTTATGTTTPLAVTGIDPIKTTASADNTFANGWEWVMHLTVPSNETAFRMKFTDWANGSTTFAANGNMELWSAQSSNASTTGSALSAVGNNFDLTNGWMYLTGDADPNTAGRQIDVHILVKIPTGTPAGSYTTTFTAQSWPSNATSTASTT